MANTCQTPGTWDQVRNSGYMSKQQWQALNLLILCEIIGGTPNMGSCTVPGLWNMVKGNPPYLSDQEFYAENINLLCQVLAAGGGGGGGSTTNPVYTGTNPPVAPAFPLQGALFAPDDATQPLQIWTPGTGWNIR